jgi:hypothetical protein
MRKVTKLLRYYSVEELQDELDKADTPEASAYWLRVAYKWWRHKVYEAFKLTHHLDD